MIYKESTEEKKAIFEGPSEVAVTMSSKEYIPNEVYMNLPEPLNQLTSQFEEREKDIVLISSLGVLSACLPNVKGKYRDSVISPNLYTFIIAPPASGKGAMRWSKLLIQPIHKEKQEEYKRKLQEYSRNQDREANEKPQRISKVIPGNVSSSKLYHHLKHSEDSVLMFETEADSLSNMLKQDWGDFSDLMRKAFHHETCSISRSDRFYEIDEPKLSLVLSGTPNQLQPLVASKENGLFSRFIYYFFDEVEGWKDVSPRNRIGSISMESSFKEAGESIKDLYNRLIKLDSIYIVMNELQWDRFNTDMKLINNVFLTNKSDFISVTKRLGVMAFRLIMILTIIRNTSRVQEESLVLEVNNNDLETVLYLIKFLTDHSLKVYDSYSKKVKKLTVQDRQILAELPEVFKRGRGVELATELEVPERTFAEILKRWQAEGILEKVKHGEYRKLV
ncbi:DUF3987 domain-containing protein [Olleya sp. AS48]|uniref:DUF3987 domain-containing protein n=1 Tax=Olleya sp. AS48 TaxID=3135774 RepID=UPI0031736065